MPSSVSATGDLHRSPEVGHQPSLMTSHTARQRRSNCGDRLFQNLGSETADVLSLKELDTAFCKYKKGHF